MDEKKKCPCCGYALEFSRSSHRVVSDQYACTAALCWFRCNAEHYEKLCKAMKAKAELDALKAAVMPVVDWYVLSKREFQTDFTSNSVVLLSGGRKGVEKVTGAQFNALEKLVLEDVELKLAH